MQIKIKVYMMFIILLLVMAVVKPTMAEEEVDESPPVIRASAAVLMEVDTGRVLFEKNMDTKRAPASLTKMMTGILAVEMGKPNEIVTVSMQGAGNKTGSDIGLRRKDQLSLGDLTKAAIMVSANDSTVVIAEHIAGREDLFVNMMNAKAKTIGAHNTSFKNTNGYSAPNHYSTAYDMALIARYGLKNSQFANIANADEEKIKWLNKDKELDIIHSNRLQRQVDWVTGVKTGTTNAAGKCLAASGKKDQMELIAVVLNSSNRYGETLKLLEYGFSLKKKIIAKGDRLGAIETEVSNPAKVHIVALENVNLLLTEEELDLVSTELLLDSDELQQKLPLEPGVAVGKAVVMLEGEKLAEVEVGVKEQVTKRKWWHR